MSLAFSLVSKSTFARRAASKPASLRSAQLLPGETLKKIAGFPVYMAEKDGITRAEVKAMLTTVRGRAKAYGRYFDTVEKKWAAGEVVMYRRIDSATQRREFEVGPVASGRSYQTVIAALDRPVANPTLSDRAAELGNLLTGLFR